MNKINFQNLPNTTTPLNATNMNQLQTNVENAILNRTVPVHDITNPIDPDTTLEPLIMTNHANGPDGSHYYYIMTIFYTSRSLTRNRVQIAYGYSTNEQFQREYYGSWRDWERVGGEKSYTITNYLENDWSANGTNNAIVLPNNTKILTISVRRGTSTTLMTLPSDLRPTGTVLVQATNGSATGLVTINTNGEVTVGSSIYTSGSSNCIFSVMYQ